MRTRMTQRICASWPFGFPVDYGSSWSIAIFPAEQRDFVACTLSGSAELAQGFGAAPGMYVRFFRDKWDKWDKWDWRRSPFPKCVCFRDERKNGKNGKFGKMGSEILEFG